MGKVNLNEIMNKTDRVMKIPNKIFEKNKKIDF